MDEEGLNERLLPGERLVWSGRPGQGLMFVAADALLIPFSLAWCGFAVFWTVMASGLGIGRHAPTGLGLFGLLFVAAGLYFVAGRFVADAWLRSKMVYGVTDRRVLILRSGHLASFTAINLDRLADVRLSERGCGAGTIRFGPPAMIWGRTGFSVWSPALDPTPQFLAIADARRVFDLVQRSAAKRS